MSEAQLAAVTASVMRRLRGDARLIRAPPLLKQNVMRVRTSLLTAVAGERDALLADIQFAFKVNAAAGGADAIFSSCDPESITSEVQAQGVISHKPLR